MNALTVIFARIRRPLPPLDRANVASGLALGFATVTLDSTQIAPVYTTLALAQASILAIVVAIALLGVQIAAGEQTVLLARRLREQKYLTGEIQQFVTAIGLAIAGIFVVPILTDWIPVLGPLGRLLFGVCTGLYATANFRSLVVIKDRFLEVLDPETILDELAEEVDTDEYLAFGANRSARDSPARSPVLEIAEIGRRGFAETDDYTGRVATDRLRSVTGDLLTVASEEDSLGEFPQDDLFGHWERLIDAAVTEGTDRSITRLGYELQRIGETLAADCEDVSHARYLSTVRYLFDRAHSHDRLRAVPGGIHDTLLDAARAHEAWKFAGEAVISAYNTMWSLSVDPPESDPARDRGVGTASALWRSQCEQWAAFVEVDDIEDDQREDLLATFEDHIGRYLGDCMATDRPCPERLGKSLGAVGVAAARRGDQDTVTRVARMLIEWQIVCEDAGVDHDEHVEEPLSRIVAAGGRDGVNEAFEAVIDAGEPTGPDPTHSDQDIDSIPIDEKGSDIDLEGCTETSALRGCRSLRSIEDVADRVERLRDEVDRHAEIHVVG